MQRFQTISSERKLDIPMYHADRHEPEDKSCFINHNRIDYVKDAMRTHEEAKRLRENQENKR